MKTYYESLDLAVDGWLLNNNILYCYYLGLLYLWLGKVCRHWIVQIVGTNEKCNLKNVVVCIYHDLDHHFSGTKYPQNIVFVDAEGKNKTGSSKAL